MTAQEQQLIDELVERIRSTSVDNKDSAAEQRLQQGLANSPDALYVLAQTVIVQKYGLEQAQGRLQSMQDELESLRAQAAQAQPAAQPGAKPSGGSFLSHLFGGGSQSTQGTSPQAPPPQGWQPVNNPGYAQAPYAPPPSYPGAGSGAGYGPPMGMGSSPLGGGGFLQSALQTAAGVAMGEMAFQSMESLFHGFGGGGGYGRGFEGDRPSETIINNYNDDGPRHEHGDEERGRDDSFYDRDNDASRDDGARGFAAANDGDRDNFAGDTADDSSNDDSGDDASFDSGDDSSFSSDDGN